MTTAIDPSLLLSNNKTERKVGNDLGKDDFLKLLITQLQNQDPSSPMDNSQFISQMATFSTLEQIVNIGSKMDTIMEYNKLNSSLNYSSFVGKEVRWHSIDETGEEPIIKEGTGVIDSIQYKDGNVLFILEDGTKLEPGNISEIMNSSSSSSSSTSTSNSLASGSELIGKLVTWKDEAGQEVSALVKSVLMSDGKLQYEMDDANGTLLVSNQMIKIASK